jgi:hypothetical protein
MEDENFIENGYSHLVRSYMLIRKISKEKKVQNHQGFLEKVLILQEL